MIEMKKCSQVSKELVYSTFTEGFSDYMIKIPMTEEQFFHHFFGQEGNRLELSYIAMEDHKGIGVVLGGIRKFDGKKTMRCGAMCVIPDKRSSGAAQRLMEAHKAEAAAQGCEQLFLEVLAENPRAIRLYEKEGYQKRHDLWYYRCENVDKLKRETDLQAEAMDFQTVKAFRDTFSDTHLNWQNEMEYMEHLPVSHFGIFEHGVLKGALSLHRGSIQFLAVSADARGKGIATALVSSAVKADESLKQLRTSFPDNADLAGFYEHLGFNKDGLYQHEMYRDCSK